LNILVVDDEPDVRCCDWPGCRGEGLHRAPKSRVQIRSYHWFCVDHVRQYNASWNYYVGMTDAEVEADLRRDTVWNRPSWPLGGVPTGNGGFRPYSADDLMDDLGVFGPEWGGGAHPRRPDAKARPGTHEAWAVAVFGLSGPVMVGAVKARYKELVKRHHPDTNGGDKAAEEKVKEINEAYRIIMGMLSP